MPVPRLRKKGHETELWVISYGDMVTLLLGFFVMLYALLAGRTTGLQEAVQQAQGQFFKSIASGAAKMTPFPPGSKTFQPLPGGGRQLLYRDLVEFAEQSKANAKIETYGDKVKITLGSDFLFDLGQADLKPGASGDLDALALIITGHPGQVIIAGHTDSTPFAPNSASPYKDNWGLSTARAATVLRYLESKGVEGRRMRAIGCAEVEPRDAEGRTGAAYDSWQRRVEVSIVPAADRLTSGYASIPTSGTGRVIADTESGSPDLGVDVERLPTYDAIGESAPGRAGRTVP